MFKPIADIASKINNWPKERIFRTLNYSIPFLIGVHIFLKPMPFEAVDEFCFYLAISILLLLLFFRKTVFTLRSPLTLPFILFFLWAVLGLFFTLDFKNTLHDLRAHLLEYLIIFYLLVNYFNSPKRLKILAFIAIASATIFSIGAVIQYYFIEGFPFNSRLGYTFREMCTNRIGFITIMGICLSLHFLYKSKNILLKILLVNCFSIMTITTLLTQSRASFFGLLAALLILCFHNRKNIIFIILTILIIIILVPNSGKRISNINGYTKDLRLKIYRLTIEVIKNHPITGIGFGMQIYGNQNVLDLENLNNQLPPEYQQKKPIFGTPHNTILDITVRTGIIGLLLFLSILTASLRMLWKTLVLKKNEYFRSWALCLLACICSFMILASFSDTASGVKAIVFYTILAMINILWNLTRSYANKTIIPAKH